jgi:hypothetical protein
MVTGWARPRLVLSASRQLQGSDEVRKRRHLNLHEGGDTLFGLPFLVLHHRIRPKPQHRPLSG